MSDASPSPRPQQNWFNVQFDDGRLTLLYGALALLLFTLTKAGAEVSHLTILWPGELVLDLLRDLGIAFIVGGIVSLGIERIARSRFQREIEGEIKKIQRNAINAAYLKRYPDRYTDFLTDLLSRELYFRFSQNITIDLILPDQPLLDASGEALLHYDQTISFIARNISSETQELRPQAFLDTDWDGQPPVLERWRVGAHELSPGEISTAEVMPQRSPLQRWYRFPRATRLQPGEEVLVQSKVRNHKHLRDVTTFCALQPADSLRFTINHPPGFQVYAQAKTPARTSDIPEISDGRRLVIELFTPVLPYTTVELGWRSNPPAGAPSAGGSVGSDLPSDHSPPTLTPEGVAHAQ